MHHLGELCACEAIRCSSEHMVQPAVAKTAKFYQSACRHAAPFWRQPMPIRDSMASKSSSSCCAC